MRKEMATSFTWLLFAKLVRTKSVESGFVLQTFRNNHMISIDEYKWTPSIRSLLIFRLLFCFLLYYFSVDSARWAINFILFNTHTIYTHTQSISITTHIGICCVLCCSRFLHSELFRFGLVWIFVVSVLFVLCQESIKTNMCMLRTRLMCASLWLLLLHRSIVFLSFLLQTVL